MKVTLAMTTGRLVAVLRGLSQDIADDIDAGIRRRPQPVRTRPDRIEEDEDERRA